MSQYTQDSRLIALTTPLGKDALLITSFSGTEFVSELFEFELETLSENHAIDAAKLVGKSVTVKIQDENSHCFNGYVYRLVTGDIISTGKSAGLRQYRLTIVPWLWFLAKRTNCRIFQNKSAVEIIEAIFGDHKVVAEFRKKLTASYEKREYCVQFNETDLEFVIRLLAEEGISYFFEHQDGKHTLVLVDQKNAYSDCKENKVEFTRGDVDFARINEWNHQYAFCEGKWTQRDYNFKKPKDTLEASTPTMVDLAPVKSYEHYRYPGYYEESGTGKRLTEARMVAEEATYNTVQAASNCSSFFAGGVFQLSRHESKAELGKYILTSVHHRIKDESYFADQLGAAGYSNAFHCVPDTVHLRPKTTIIKPIMRGPQTAVVVGAKGEEIDIDEFGRIKVQFYWDREGKFDEKSSCWIRVAQPYAGKKWGQQITPRIGQEVIVNFIDGDPDRPIVTGAVYNADNMPPYPTKTQHGIKSHSTTGGGASNFNELRFEDKKGSEEIFIQAEKDFRRLVKNDEESEIKANHRMKVTKASEQEAKSVLVKASDFIELKVGGSSVKITPTSIEVKSTMVTVKGSAMVVVNGGLVKIN
jgi:type VI secretion system secreted protein VgrG